MTRKLFLTTSALVMLGTATLAETTAQDVISGLRARGFSDIEVKVGPSQIKAEASNGTDKLEVVVDRASGSTLKQELYAGQGGEVDPGIEIDMRQRDFVRRSDDSSVGDDDDDDDRSSRSNRGSGSGSDDNDDDDRGGHGRGGDDDDHGGRGGDHDNSGRGSDDD